MFPRESSSLNSSKASITSSRGASITSSRASLTSSLNSENNFSNLDDTSLFYTSGKKNMRPPRIDVIGSLNDSRPVSPTDQSCSPTTMKLRLQRKHPSVDNSPANKNSFDLERNVTQKEYPLPNDCQLILGSSSKSRKQVLDIIGWPFTVLSPDIDGKAIRCKNPYELPQLIAQAKAGVLLERLKESKRTGPLVLITSDQIVLYQNQLREKPESAEEATRFLNSYSNNYVTTVSAVVATHYPSERQCCDIDVAHVYWNEISDEVVQKVVARGDIFTSAGGFRIDDPDLNPLIRDVDGPLDSVVGMPVELTYRLINVVKDALAFEINHLTQSLYSNKSNNLEQNFEDVWRNRRPSDTPTCMRLRSHSFGRSRAGSTETHSTANQARNRAMSGKSDTAAEPSQSIPFPMPISIPSSPTDRNAVARQPADRQKKVASSEFYNRINFMKKHEFHLLTDVTRRPYPYPLTSSQTQLILGGDNSLKQQVLTINNWSFVSMMSDVGTSNIGSLSKTSQDSPIRFAEYIAKAETGSIFAKLSSNKTYAKAIIIATHQVIVHESNVRLFPPKNIEEALAWLLSYSNQRVMAVTVVVATHYPSNRQAIDTDAAIVHFKEITTEVAESVCRRADTLSQIGAINIEDVDLNPLIHRIDGAIDSIVALPVDLVTRVILNVSDDYIVQPILSSALPKATGLSKLGLSPSGNSGLSMVARSSMSSATVSLTHSYDSSLVEDDISTQQSTPAPSMKGREITMICPGKKVPIRAEANVTSEVKRYITSGEKIFVLDKTVAGFYQLGSGETSACAAAVSGVIALLVKSYGKEESKAAKKVVKEEMLTVAKITMDREAIIGDRLVEVCGCTIV
ncbi:unnamed protein product [Sphagnum jensenii]|uniref:Maf-like protein n=1 Tax=Sphagnum jensenii TaxID=128206 RepID=A0ABP0VAJ0_9BRYO